MAFDSRWAFDEDRCYHGIHAADGARKIVVERSIFGLTERHSPEVLRELSPLDPVISFHWGYTGSGPNSSAAAILFDALGFEAADGLRHAFVWDWLGVVGDEFYFRRPAILRWARGLFAQRDVVKLPQVLSDLPPVDPGEYALSPAALERVRELRERNS